MSREMSDAQQTYDADYPAYLEDGGDPGCPHPRIERTGRCDECGYVDEDLAEQAREDAMLERAERDKERWDD